MVTEPVQISSYNSLSVYNSLERDPGLNVPNIINTLKSGFCNQRSEWLECKLSKAFVHFFAKFMQFLMIFQSFTALLARSAVKNHQKGQKSSNKCRKDLCYVQLVFDSSETRIWRTIWSITKQYSTYCILLLCSIVYLVPTHIKMFLFKKK